MKITPSVFALFGYLLLASGLVAKAPSPVKAAKANVDLSALQHPVQPMLWKIEGKGLKKPSYLFGTVHLSDSRVTTLHPLAQKSFDDSSAFYAEVDLDPAKAMGMVQFLLREDKKTFAEVAGEKLANEAEAELKAINQALSLAPFDRFELWALAVMLPQLESQFQGAKPLDLQLWEKAVKAGKSAAPLETMIEQTSGLDSLSLAEQKSLLSLTLAEMRVAREEKRMAYQPLFDAYLLGDLQILTQAIDESMLAGGKMDQALRDRLAEKLLYERNARMAKVIIERLTDQSAVSHFFAVGTAHYLGDKNIRSFLEKQGYRISLIKPDQ